MILYNSRVYEDDGDDEGNDSDDGGRTFRRKLIADEFRKRRKV